MPSTVAKYTLEELAEPSDNNTIIIQTEANTELFISACEDNSKTYITLPFGNKFDIVDGRIIIHSKK